MLLESHFLKCIVRAKTMLELIAAQKITQPGLHHRPQIAGRVMVKIHDLDRSALEQDHHALSDIVS